MGNDPAQISTFNKEQWDLVERSATSSLWRSRKDPSLHIEQYDIYSKDGQQHEHQRQSFHFRQQCPQLVAGLFFREQKQHQFCSTAHQSSLFIEKIPIRLTDIEHIPFPDCLHLYFQALSGFQAIAQKYGFFEVQEEHIGVNEKAVVKVWLNRDFSRSYINGGKITQEQMLKGIVDILDKNCDPHLPGNTPTIRNYLYRNADSLSFDQASAELRSYCVSFNRGYVPEKLQCIDRVGGIYAIANRISAEGQNLDSARYSHDSPRKAQGAFQRPRISSDHHLELEQKIPYQEGSVGQLNLKASQALPNSSREILIINPNAYRQNMAIIRRRKEEEPRQPIQINPMKLSQNGTQLHNSSIQGPIKISHLQTPAQNQTQGIQFSVPQKMIPVTLQDHQVQSIPLIKPPAVQKQNTAHQPTHQQFTFKTVNQPYFSNAPQGNTSITNFSLGPSQSSTKRARDQLASQHPLPPQVPHRYNQTVMQNPSQHKHPVPRQPQGEFKANAQPIRVPQVQQINNTVIHNKEAMQQPSSGTKPFLKDNNAEKIQTEQERLRLGTETVSQAQKISPNTITEIGVESSMRPFTNNDNENHLSTSFKSKNYMINADDGKSSEEFMRKLKEMTQGLSSVSQSKDQRFPTATYSEYSPNDANITSGTSNFQPKYSYQPNIQGRTVTADDEQFGRNAVSNIIQTQQVFTKQYSGFSSEPLKFETNLAMKYSRLEADEPSPPRRSNVGIYEPEMDPDLLADMRKIKQ